MMETISTLFVSRKQGFHNAILSADPKEIPQVTQETLWVLYNDYLSQEEQSPAFENIIKVFFGLVADAVQNASTLSNLVNQSERDRPSEDMLAEDQAASSRMEAPLSEGEGLLWKATFAMASALFLSILLELTVLSALLAIVIALTAYLVLSGKWSEVVKSWPFNLMIKRKTSRKTFANNLDAEQEQDEREAQIRAYIAGFESLLRRMDVILEMIHKAVPTPSLRASIPVSETTLQFMQDLAEAAQQENGAFALQLVHSRLGAVASSLHLDLCEYSPEIAACFVVDTAMSGEGEIPGTQTIKPAIMRDGECLLPGYARQVS
ncbi:hypothetical protein Nhal_3034 [Nitrosococcus halophilus Nc 4]|uniref:Uncharacterized protein n=1 Tax=Nitrosococcus halophilus (strain Nc4) TaxID=472759 RepID=D5BZ74_NITHN|nr:hypothetical protein [Nitrosococcus halophilus]ADE16088.1 hypothetical protein Nhal_3034 [Nitrosococcus halophilus Nc 4]